MVRRKTIAPVPSEDPPAQQCSSCWFFESRDTESGTCFGVPPVVAFDSEGEPTLAARPVVDMEDRGCHIFRPRHTA